MHDDVIADAGKFANDYLAPNAQAWEMNRSMPRAVSYTHLTLPTIYSV